MLRLRVLYIIRLVLLKLPVLEGLLFGRGCGYHARFFQEGFLEIIPFELLQVEICLQGMIQLLLRGEQLVGDLYYRIIVPKTVGIQIAAQVVWNEHLQIMFHVQDELLLRQRLLLENGSDVEYVDEDA